ncbi:DUF300-domain-containing protein [Artomyces pyxidatus]|uniref:DUF300-domain-containing protein n=1 Tax=Artomyces pyxidatus TaxID=48021 RepID=A0ACB8SZB3_9AGAM|nr:DUF300-domain-containing protein [Artomyces pyxidatus]
MSSNSSRQCFTPKAPQQGPPLFQHGNIVFQAHDVGWIICGFFTIVASITSFWLIGKHLQWYTNKAEQRYIVRLLFMVPIYATISLASYLFWDHATPLLLIRDAYEAILLTAFFYLLLTYLSPDPEVQKAIFRKEGLSRENDAARIRRGLDVKKWVLPFRSVKWKPRDGLDFLQLMKWGVLQYCIVRPVTTLAAVILNYIGWYCEDSWSPAWGHIWVTSIISMSVTIGMYCLLQLYLSVATELAPHKPVLKLFSVKAVVFLTFWQATFLSLLTMLGVVKDTPYMTADDINIGWGAILECFEMTIFAFVHVKAFSYKPYRPKTPDAQRTPRLRSLGHAMDFRETFRELRSGCLYMMHRMRGMETDTQARREAALESVFGKSRTQVWREQEKGADNGGPMQVGIDVDKVVEVEGETQWLGAGDNYGYGLARRERSESLGVQIAEELQKMGYVRPGKRVLPTIAGTYLGDLRDKEPVLEPSPPRRRRSWWRGLYDRVSQGNPDDEPRKARNRSHTPALSQDAEGRALMYMYDDLPPPSIIRTYRERRGSRDAAPPIALPTLRSSGDRYPAVVPPILEMPIQQSSPIPTHAPPLKRADSLFDRLFPHGLPTSEGHSTRSGRTSAIPPSSQSHNTQVRLGPSWDVVTRQVDGPRSVTAEIQHVEPAPSPTKGPFVAPSSSRIPVEAAPSLPTPPPDQADRRRRSHRRESAQYVSNPTAGTEQRIEPSLSGRPSSSRVPPPVWNGDPPPPPARSPRRTSNPPRPDGLPMQPTFSAQPPRLSRSHGQRRRSTQLDGPSPSSPPGVWDRQRNS